MDVDGSLGIFMEDGACVDDLPLQHAGIPQLCWITRGSEAGEGHTDMKLQPLRARFQQNKEVLVEE